MKYIVTNCTPGGNYTPSIFTNKEDAVKWMKECAADNIEAAFNCELEEEFGEEIYEDDFDDDGNIERILEYAEENLDVKIFEDQIEIYYADDSYNILQLFEVTE